MTTPETIATSIPDHLPQHLNIDRGKLNQVADRFPMRISPHFLSLIQAADDPIARQVIPDIRELSDPNTEADPLREESQSPVPQIIHRYPHRVIFLVSNQCAVYCRFCMRKRRLVKAAKVSDDAIGQGLDYIRENKAINEVILSGGDPLMLSDTALTKILAALRRLPHVRILRIHTRIPNARPRRITPALARQLSVFHPLFVNIHFNHPEEISPAAQMACALLADAGIALGSQTVLLRDINDDPQILRSLMLKLMEIRVRPYYIHQLDRVPGSAHFRVPMDKALKLMATLRGHLSGMAVPHFMVDLPGGGGKVALVPESIVSRKENHWVLRNFEGREFIYPTE